jgi:hypothetical protein
VAHHTLEKRENKMQDMQETSTYQGMKDRKEGPNTCGKNFFATPINIKKHRKASLYTIYKDSILIL